MDKTYKGLPIYDAALGSEHDGILRISLVDDPAVMSDFIALAVQQRTLSFKVESEEKRLISGVIMRANFPIYRRDESGYEYYIVYKPETIRAMAEKYLADNRQNAVNLMHKAGSDVDGVQMVQWFIKDTARGIAPEGFDDISDGSLFAEFHVENDDVWDGVKDGTFKGFSLEGLFEIKPEQFNNHKSTPMSKMNRIKEALRRALMAFGEVTTDKGILGWDGDEDLKAGDAVYIVNEDGSRSEAADGDYVTEDGKTIAVADGKVSEIRDPEAEVEAFGTVETENGTLYHEGDEDLKAGDAVFADEALSEPAADGEYKTADGKTIVVVEGKVAEIRDAEAEVAPEEAYRRIRVAHEESYNERFRRIAEAIAAKGYEDFYVEDAGDDFAVISNYSEEGIKYLRFPITWDEDENATAGDEVEVKLMFVPLDFESPFEKRAEEAEAELASVKTQLAALRKENAALKAKPAAKPAHEEVTFHSAATATGVKGLDRLAARLKK